MTRYRLIREYPNHKIGDIAIVTTTPPGKGQNTFTWEEGGMNIPVQFYLNNAPDWWQKIEEEKSLCDYEKQIDLPLPLALRYEFPRIYWTEVLRCIAKDLNKSKLVQYCIGRTPVLHWRSNNKEPIRYIVTIDTSEGMKQGLVYFDEIKTCQKAIDLLGENIKYLFND